MASDSTEGIISGDSRIGSIAKTQVVDLISEGEIDGLVTKE
jgi:predicted phage tail protein